MGSRSYKKHKKTKHSRRNKRYMRKTRKMRGGGSMGMGMDVALNPSLAGCKSDNTFGIGARQLHTPLAVGGQRGGDKACTESPYKFLQSGGKGGRTRVRYNKKMSRHMKGGGNFWNFSKLWNPSHPNEGGNILGLSDRGISPSGIASPASTAANRAIPPIQPWPTQKLILHHDYTKGGAQVGGSGRKGSAKRGRKLKGGGILQDVENLGRSISHGFGSLINGVSGYSNQIYNTNPLPTVQYPRGLGNELVKEYTPLGTSLKNIYDNAYARSAIM
jgi:hypothetical protein